MMLMIHMIPKVFLMPPMLILLLFVVIGVIILSIKFCSKRPWIVVIIALGLLLIVPYFVLVSSHRTISHHTEVILPSTRPPSQETTTSIWLPGIEDEFEADVYPSMKSAVRGLGSYIHKSVLDMVGDVNQPAQIVLFQEASDSQLVQELKKAIHRVMPEANCAIEADLRNLKPNEVGITMWIVGKGSQAAPWANSPEIRSANGDIQVNVFTVDKNMLSQRHFIDKQWVEDFSGFLNTRPNSRFLIARSAESCMSEAEANNKAFQNACTQVADMIGQTPLRRDGIPISFAKPVDSTDILEGNFILDRFVQSFDGAAGKIWRQALLVDISAEKLKNLAQRKAIIAQARKTSFARMFFSIVGLIVLITIVYAFLNAATKGYYTWSLRIAGAVFALVLIILLFVK